MRRIFLSLAVMFGMAAGVIAGPYFVVPLTQNNVTTNSSATPDTTTYNQRVTGELKQVIIDASGTVTNVNIAIATTTAGALGFARTLFTKDNTSAVTDHDVAIGQQMYQPGLTICTNSYAPIYLYNDIITMTTSAAAQTNVNIKAYLIIQNK